MFTVEEVLKNSVADGNVLKLPNIQLDRKLYLEVKKALEVLGGKWKGGKVAGFVFPGDAINFVSALLNHTGTNLKKDFQFFATPADYADYMVSLVRDAVLRARNILEPSAGQGALIDAVHRVRPDVVVDAYELMEINCQILESKYGDKIFMCGCDFLTEASPAHGQYDLIIANPPFSKNQDITHILKMWRMLAPGGKLVTLSSRHWEASEYDQETQFRDFLAAAGATIYEVPEGTFKASGTMVGAYLLLLSK
jgi:predicted RNA methylase